MSTEARRTVASFDALVHTLTHARHEIDELVLRVSAARNTIASGVVLSEFVATEERPLIISRMTALIDLMSDAAAEVRRAEAHQLRAEGLSHVGIAQLFGVTRQRAAALLAPPSATQLRNGNRSRQHDG